MVNTYSRTGSYPIVEDGSGSTFDRLFTVLADQRRRYVLYYLQMTPRDVVQYDQLVTKVAEWETESDTPPTEDHLEEIELALQHHHLPRLEDYGMIDYDPRTKTIRYCDDISKQEWLEQAKTEEIGHNELQG
ncbi:DUF7344 domain-containing protein [Halomontanus rarus]|uniref:DUF7344 domain-containing protein n=1 Tax=Halomontanus rarus TaxID=3034020 RepID=UPI0023E88D10|nr:hypothetical protein [Halovivax sp. TS33]